jgi:oligopeptide transport system permease protein
VLTFTARRLGQAVLVIVVTTFLMYVGVIQLGDPFKFRGERTIPPEIRATLRAHFGLDKPVYLQYLTYLKHIFTGDFGVDFEKRKPVAELIGAVFPNTLRLALVAILIDLFIGGLAGVAAAVWRDSYLDTLVSVTTILVLCTPIIVIGMWLRFHLTGLHIFGFELFPQLPHPSTVDVPRYREVLLPAFTLAIFDLAFLARLMRASMLEVLQADYLRTARAKGLPERVVILKHGVRNALIPVINHIGVIFGILFGGTVIVETIFQYNGIGYLFDKALGLPNIPMLIAIAVLSVITFVVLSAVVDVVCAYLDPRIRIS